MPLADLPLACLAGLEGLLVRAPAGGRKISRNLFEGLSLAGKAVLVHTGWDRHWRSDQYFEGHPFLTAAAAQLLVDVGATLVGSPHPNAPSVARTPRRTYGAIVRSMVSMLPK